MFGCFIAFALGWVVLINSVDCCYFSLLSLVYLDIVVYIVPVWCCCGWIVCLLCVNAVLSKIVLCLFTCVGCCVMIAVVLLSTFDWLSCVACFG